MPLPIKNYQDEDRASLNVTESGRGHVIWILRIKHLCSFSNIFNYIKGGTTGAYCFITSDLNSEFDYLKQVYHFPFIFWDKF